MTTAAAMVWHGAVEPAFAATWRKISLPGLSGKLSALAIGGDYECFGRAEWRALRTGNGLEFDERRSMDSSLMYQAVDGTGNSPNAVFRDFFEKFRNN